MIHCFFHKANHNGFASGAIVRYAVNEKLNMIPVHYGDNLDFNTLNKDDVVIVVDFTFNPQQMLKIKESVKEFIWIDHHKNSIIQSEKNGYSDLPGIRSQEMASCELTWKFFMPDKPIPYAVYLIGRYDVWDHKDTNVIPFHYALEDETIFPSLASTREFWKRLFEEDNGLVTTLCYDGKIINRHIINKNSRLCKNKTYDIEFEGLKLLCTNQSGVNFKFFETKFDPKIYDGCCVFSYMKGGWNVSLYTNKNTNRLFEVALKYGGGGHPKSCGFRLTDITPLL